MAAADLNLSSLLILKLLDGLFSEIEGENKNWSLSSRLCTLGVLIFLLTIAIYDSYSWIDSILSEPIKGIYSRLEPDTFVSPAFLLKFKLSCKLKQGVGAYPSLIAISSETPEFLNPSKLYL